MLDAKHIPVDENHRFLTFCFTLISFTLLLHTTFFFLILFSEQLNFILNKTFFSANWYPPPHFLPIQFELLKPMFLHLWCIIRLAEPAIVPTFPYRYNPTPVNSCRNSISQLVSGHEIMSSNVPIVYPSSLTVP